MPKIKEEHTQQYMRRVEAVIDLMATHLPWLHNKRRENLVDAVMDMLKDKDGKTVSERQARRYIQDAEKYWNSYTRRNTEHELEHRTKQLERIFRKAFLRNELHIARQTIVDVAKMQGLFASDDKMQSGSGGNVTMIFQSHGEKPIRSEKDIPDK